MTVLKCEPEQERLLLSFRLAEDAISKNAGRTETSKNHEMVYETGQVIYSKICIFHYLRRMSEANITAVRDNRRYFFTP